LASDDEVWAGVEPAGCIVKRLLVYEDVTQWRTEPLGWWDDHFDGDFERDPDLRELAMPGLPGFWHAYREHIHSFIDAGAEFAAALDADNPDGPAILQRFVDPVRPVLVRQGDGAELRWDSPSLIGSLAMMALLDTTGGAYVGRCEVCGSLFIAGKPAKYCGPRHKRTARMRRYRESKRKETP
jgi:hypothetical protein